MGAVRIPNENVLRNPSLAKPRTYCLHPEKLSFPTAAAARKAERRLARSHDRHTPCEPYRCSCGKFHLTTVRTDT